jgi:TIR domain/Interferon-induced transmembrane protein
MAAPMSGVLFRGSLPHIMMYIYNPMQRSLREGEMSNLLGPGSESQTRKQLFLSYARDDRELVLPLKEGVEVLGHGLWIDDRIHAGHLWWNEILDEIRQCDAMIVAISPALLDSKASKLERTYAQELGKPIIPVVVDPVRALPPDIYTVQMINYAKDPGSAPFHLAGLLSSLPSAPPLPNPMPAPPSAPPDVMSELGEKVHKSQLSDAEQVEMLMNLRTLVGQPKTYAAASDLLRELKNRGDLPYYVVREADEILQKHRKAHPGSSFTQQQSPPRRLVLSIVAVILTVWPMLTIPGLISLYFSSQVGTRWKLQDYSGARRASITALVVAYVGIGSNLLIWFLYAQASSTTTPYYWPYY